MSWQEIHEFFAPIRVLWFTLLFVGIVLWVYWPKRRDELEAHARIPLVDDSGDDAAGKR
ncbi:MAG: cbb3-type cytochrome oxidase subunit 3 [Pseudomonadota bacterium]